MRTIMKTIELGENEFYIYLANEDLLEQEPQEVIEGVHFDIVKVEILTIDLDMYPQVMDENVKCKVTVRPLEPLPDWFDDDDYFECINVESLYNSTCWIPLQELGIDYDCKIISKPK